MIRAPVVFVVDDDPSMRAALKRLFVAARIEVQTFASGRELLDSCDFSRSRRLLPDAVMPEMDGLQLQDVLR